MIVWVYSVTAPDDVSVEDLKQVPVPHGLVVDILGSRL